ncbi:unnamed protein product [Phaeothamnion confervicola]
MCGETEWGGSEWRQSSRMGPLLSAARPARGEDSARRRSHVVAAANEPMLIERKSLEGAAASICTDRRCFGGLAKRSRDARSCNDTLYRVWLKPCCGIGLVGEWGHDAKEAPKRLHTSREVRGTNVAYLSAWPLPLLISGCCICHRPGKAPLCALV